MARILGWVAAFALLGALAAMPASEALVPASVPVSPLCDQWTLTHVDSAVATCTQAPAGVGVELHLGTVSTTCFGIEPVGVAASATTMFAVEPLHPRVRLAWQTTTRSWAGTDHLAIVIDGAVVGTVGFWPAPPPTPPCGLLGGAFTSPPLPLVPRLHTLSLKVQADGWGDTFEAKVTGIEVV